MDKNPPINLDFHTDGGTTKGGLFIETLIRIG